MFGHFLNLENTPYPNIGLYRSGLVTGFQHINGLKNRHYGPTPLMVLMPIFLHGYACKTENY
jgi:hypothetical protein